jgi:histidinol-phosphate aminotransferase
LPPREIDAFLDQVPSDVCVVIDEAYCEFSDLAEDESPRALLEAHPNVVLLRTFSKVYGLSGFRVGYALAGTREFVDAVDRVRQPFSCGVVGQAAAIEALRQQDHVRQRVDDNRAARSGVTAELAGLGLEVPPSQANFCWVRLPPAADEDAVAEGLLARGVLVRTGAPLGAPGALRVTFGSSKENERFLQAIAAIVG